MKTLVFTSQKNFVQKLRVRCLSAALPNSAVSRLAEKRRQRLGDDPEFTVYLRGGRKKNPPEWQRHILSGLFDREGLSKAIEEGMQNYYTTCDGALSALNETVRQGFEGRSFLPHLILESVVIDVERQNAFLVLDNALDAHLMEHGLVIALKDGTWMYDPGGYNAYLAEIEELAGEDGADSNDAKLKSRSKVEPVDATFMFGMWYYDAESDAEYLKKLGNTDEEVRMAVDFWRRRAFELSQELSLFWHSYAPSRKPDQDKILGFGKRGNVYLVTFWDSGTESETTWEFLYEDGLLRHPNGGTFTRNPP